MDEPEGNGLEDRRAKRHHYNADEDPVSARSYGRRDYDRLLYTPYFHRLAAVTQVVATTTETALIHNRMTHSLKVAQLSRELSETLLNQVDPELLVEMGGLSADVSAAAGLAHDLGHPPFGHIGEQQLDRALLDREILEGYDGNAQTFRIITLLGVKKNTIPDHPGLDLSAATRNAVLKYPIGYEDLAAEAAGGGVVWNHESRPTDNTRPKFGYYSSDAEEYKLARDPHCLGANSRSLECQVMDLCDDISYAVHDLEDFIRTGVITTTTLASPPRGFETLIKGRIQATFLRRGEVESDAVRLADRGWKLATGLLSADEEVFRPLQDPYRGTTEQQASLSALSSFYIESFLSEVSIKDKEA
ncbi:MAG TPA: dNTP triphosphohydrolase, partial [Polyangiaceae bacterium]